MQTNRKTRILFLCADNGARSQIAEAMMRLRGSDVCDVMSAGIHPLAAVDPLVAAVLDEVGADHARLRPKEVADFLAKAEVDVAVMLTDHTEHGPRIYPFAKRILHWPLPNPSIIGNGDQKAVLKLLREELDRHIAVFLDQSREGSSIVAHSATNSFIAHA